MYNPRFLRVEKYKAKKVSVSSTPINIAESGYEYIIIKNVGSNAIEITNEGGSSGFEIGAGETFELFIPKGNVYIMSGSGSTASILLLKLDTVG